MTRRLITRIERREAVVEAETQFRPTYTLVIVHPGGTDELYDTLVPVPGGGWRFTRVDADQLEAQ